MTDVEGGLPTFAASRTNGRDEQVTGFTKAGATVCPREMTAKSYRPYRHLMGYPSGLPALASDSVS